MREDGKAPFGAECVVMDDFGLGVKIDTLPIDWLERDEDGELAAVHIKRQHYGDNVYRAARILANIFDVEVVVG